MPRRCRTLVLSLAVGIFTAHGASVEYPTKSGIKTWVDPNTPDDRQVYTTSRGRKWELVMSDEFNEADRNFRPGHDHIWTSLEKPDGVNSALETYSHNMTSTKCDDDGTCYFYIKIVDDHQQLRVYNMYLNPPAYETVEFFYRSGMVQSWNKFCFQGGMVEVRAQLPGAVSSKSGNPDLSKGNSGRASTIDYYPTWPGIWMMGNLGRAIFSGSTSRVWPFSYNECKPGVFDSKNQRINACDDNPGYGLNPNQGRGAPEIDILEGGGTDISSSLQVGPGMPTKFRVISPDPTIENAYCIYSGDCKTPGANHPGVPSATYNKRGYKSWYQGLRYAANPFCASDSSKKQDYATVAASVKTGITKNTCDVTNCPGSKDGYADLGHIDDVGPGYWGVNSNGTCFPVMNAYTGAFLCDPDNQNELCENPRPDNVTKSNIMTEFSYQMDAISSNWPVHLGAYLDYLIYQVEWVTGKNGYVRWMLDGYPIFEVTADTFTSVPQDSAKSNPQKIMLEEPMYLIMNVALSTSWGSKPPNPGKECRGDGSDATANAICDDFPMYLKVDYIRLYQDQGTDLGADNYMQVGCNPKSHPTREWILGHIDSYQDYDNMLIDVAGGAYCRTDEDCTIGKTEGLGTINLITGMCENKRCKCTHGDSWSGPRCTIAMQNTQTGTSGTKTSGFGPPMALAIAMAALVIVLTIVSVWLASRQTNELTRSQMLAKPGRLSGATTEVAFDAPKGDYSHNFV